MSVHGAPCVLAGALLAFLIDILASNDLGGFKKSYSFAFCSCHTCIVTRDTLQLLVLNFNCGYTETDKPVPILKTQFGHLDLKWCYFLVFYLPFLLGDKYQKIMTLTYMVVSLPLFPSRYDHFGYSPKQYLLFVVILYSTHKGSLLIWI